jgi:protein SCO1
MSRACRVRFVFWLVLGVVALSAAPAAARPSFTLAATDGGTITDQSFRGKWQLIYFGYTFCPDICPTTLTAIAGALDALGPRAASVRPLFITIDPGRDTPQILAAYAKAIDPRIVALTGTHTQTAAAARAFGVVYERQDGDNGAYFFDHTSYVYVLDPRGNLVETLSDSADSKNIVRHLSKLLSAGEKP